MTQQKKLCHFCENEATQIDPYSFFISCENHKEIEKEYKTKSLSINSGKAFPDLNFSKKYFPKLKIYHENKNSI